MYVGQLTIVSTLSSTKIYNIINIAQINAAFEYESAL